MSIAGGLLPREDGLFVISWITNEYGGEAAQKVEPVARLVGEGLSSAAVARRLSESVLTIKTQLNSVFRKLGVESRAKLMAMLR